MVLKHNYAGSPTVLPSLADRDEAVRRASRIIPSERAVGMVSATDPHARDDEELPLPQQPQAVVPSRFFRRPTDQRPGRPVINPNDCPGHRPTTPDEIAAHNARIMAASVARSDARWAEFAAGRSQPEPRKVKCLKSTTK